MDGAGAGHRRCESARGAYASRRRIDDQSAAFYGATPAGRGPRLCPMDRFGDAQSANVDRDDRRHGRHLGWRRWNKRGA